MGYSPQRVPQKVCPGGAWYTGCSISIPFYKNSPYQVVSLPWDFELLQAFLAASAASAACTAAAIGGVAGVAGAGVAGAGVAGAGGMDGSTGT